MRYSWIVENFYSIKLEPGVKDMVDVHFTASAHHWLMMKASMAEFHIQYHRRRHREHLYAMMLLVHDYGDFATAIDQSLRGMELRCSWNPKVNFNLPDPNMFNSMEADKSCRFGQSHPSDEYIASTNDGDGFLRKHAC